MIQREARDRTQKGMNMFSIKKNKNGNELSRLEQSKPRIYVH